MFPLVSTAVLVGLTARPTPPSGAPTLTAALSATDVVAGAEVTLHQSISPSAAGQTAFSHYTAVQTDRFDEGGQLVSLAVAGLPAPPIQLLEAFPNMPHGVSMGPGFLLTPDPNGRRGFDLKFKTAQPGVYRITAAWQLRGQVGLLEAPPVTLTVRPALPAKKP